MADVLNASHSPNLGLSPLTSPHEDFLPFSQSNVTASRKQVLPIVKSFLAGETTPDDTQMDAFSDLPKDRSEGFTSMSSIVENKDPLDGEITSEDLTSRDNSTEAELSPEDRLMPGGKVFDPLSSVHSSDGPASPIDFNRSAKAQDDDRQLPGSGEMSFDLLGDVGSSGAEVEGEEKSLRVSPPTVKVVGGEEGMGNGSNEHENTGVGLENPDPFQDPGLSENDVNPSNNNVEDPLDDGGDNDDELEQDLLNMASPHDLLFPADSPLDVSAATSGHNSGQASEQTSGQVSQVSSYPVTPPNSYMEDGVMVKEVRGE